MWPSGESERDRQGPLMWTLLGLLAGLALATVATGLLTLAQALSLTLTPTLILTLALALSLTLTLTRSPLVCGA